MPPISDATNTPRREPEPERFKLCEECGQMYDARHLGEHHHHNDGTGVAHDPLETP